MCLRQEGGSRLMWKYIAKTIVAGSRLAFGKTVIAAILYLFVYCVL
jgi:hypothetical protein